MVVSSTALLPRTSSHYTIPKHWQTHRTHQPNTLTDGLASHLLMCCVVVSSPSTPVNMGRCCRVASHLLCLCCPTPALPVRHTAACGCVIDCHVASHLLSLRRRQAVITLASKDRQTDRRAVIGSFQRLCHRLRCVISDRIVANCQVASHLLCSRNCQVA